MKQYNKPRKSCALFGLGFLETIPSPRLGFLRGVFLANHLASTDFRFNVSITTLLVILEMTMQKVALVNSTTHTQKKLWLREREDR